QRLLVGVADRVNDKIDRRPARGERRESLVELRHAGAVAIDEEIAAEFVGERLHPLQHHIALIADGKFRLRAVQRLGNAPCERFVVRKAHDQPALALHQTRHLVSPTLLSSTMASSTRPIASCPKSSTSTSAAFSSPPITIPTPAR